MKSSTKEIRELLKQGYAYSEIHAMTGYPLRSIHKQAFVLEEEGIQIRKRTDEEIKRYILTKNKERYIPKGSISDILDALTLEEINDLMRKSTASWADAIIKTIKERNDATQI